MSVSLRPSRAAIRISGEEAAKWLHDVLTAAVKAEDGYVAWWALLSAQGKVQAEGLISWHEDAFWLDVSGEVADSFLKRMKLYKLRAKAEIEDMRETHAVGWSADASAIGVCDKDPRGDGLGYRVIAERDAAEGWDGDDRSFAAARIARGIAEMGPDFATDSVFPHDIGMDHLKGVDFKKGCYVGQEVVSRMQHRGTARRRPVIVSGEALESGRAVQVGTREAGTLGTAIDGKAVAIVRIDRVKKDAAPEVGGNTVQLALPDWASYDFADSTEPTDDPDT